MANKTTTCATCGNQFSFGVGRGLARKYCGPECASASQVKARADRVAALPSCGVDGCQRKARSSKQPLCETHYYRVRRNGSLALKLETNPPPACVSHTQGYVLEWAPNHPLARGSSRVYQHRLVLHEALGEGPFDCHWCGVSVTWDDMHVDHLNGVRDDNAPSNLVPSCPACNIKRGTETMTATHRARSKAKVEWQGESLTLGEWGARLGITAQSVRFRLAAGWEKGRALTEPRGVTGPRPSRRQTGGG